MMTAPQGQPVNTIQPPPQQRQPMPPGMQPQQPANVFTQSANALNTGMAGAANAAGYQAQQIDPNAVTGATTAYMSPYQQQVTNTTMDQLAQQQAMAMNTLDAQASAANAFGGSRHGVAMGSTMGEYADAQAQALAGLNYQGYTQAQNLAMQQAMANQSAGLQAANVNLAGANALGGLSNLGFTQGMTIAGQQATMGAEQQAMNQQLMDQAMQQYAGFTQYPTYSMNTLYPALGVQTGQTATGTEQYNPGLFDYLSLGATAMTG